MNFTLTDEERNTGKLSPKKLDTLAELVRVNGYVVLESVIPRKQIEEIRAAFDPLFDEYIGRRGYNTGKNRAQMFLPFERPYCDENIVCNPIAMSVVDRILGDDSRCIYFASDTPMPGSDYQNAHCDIRPLFPDFSVPLPIFNLVVNIPLVDVTEDNGPLEIWPGGTHLNPDRSNHDTLDGSVNPHLDIVRAASHMPSEKVLMPAGSVVIRDIRVWHRGTPNRSDYRRTNLAFIYSKSWYGYGSSIPIPQETYDAMSERCKRLFRFEKIGSPARKPWE
ncbi:phytanoyl-CoA dioxygenase family protein [Paenibacillus humicola]|uniref:phytanoyl-CoA dioxygenase family protein n=1 Tax=Paenibacillus humicola TaxID=3110540 RepID=UPI00237BDDFB|nr:phytanoyl-CoA dioxygenase family protein [Paenibacillus humicola]